MTIKLTDDELIKVLNGGGLYKVMRSILEREEEIDQNREHFWVVGLDMANTILFIELVSMGSMKATVVEPMEVFSLAVTKRSARIVLVHNHPSGTLHPSDADKDITDRLIQVGLILNTPVYDHLIISLDNYFSFLDSGLLEKLEQSLKYVAPYIQQERMKHKVREFYKQKGEDRLSRKMARQMKTDGVDIEFIATYTGLTIQQIKRMKIKKE